MENSEEKKVSSVTVIRHFEDGSEERNEFKYLIGAGIGLAQADETYDTGDDGAPKRVGTITFNAGSVNMIEKVCVHNSLLNMLDPVSLIVAEKILREDHEGDRHCQDKEEE